MYEQKIKLTSLSDSLSDFLGLYIRHSWSFLDVALSHLRTDVLFELDSLRPCLDLYIPVDDSFLQGLNLRNMH